MILQLFILFIVCAVIHLYLKWCAVKKYWAIRNVPHEPPHPVFGSLTFLQKHNPAIWYRRIYNKYRNEPYVGIWLFWRPALIVNDPEIIRRIFLKDSANFRDRFVCCGKNDLIGHLNLFTLKDPLWSFMRKRLSFVFTASKLRNLQTITKSKARYLVERIAVETEKGHKLSLRSVYTDYTTDVIGESSFGVKGEVTKSGKGPLRDITGVFEKFDTIRGLAWSSIFFLPEMCNVFGLSMFPKPSVKLLKSIFYSAVEERGGFDSETIGDRDLLDALLKIKKEIPLQGNYMHEDLLCAQATVFLQAGYDTSGVNLSYATYELAFQPDLQDRLYAELTEAKEQIGDAPFDSETLSKLPFLNAVLKETLRKYPVFGWIDRVAANNYKIDDNLTIPAKSVVYINAIGLMSDQKYFPEPEKFIPDRFLPGNEAKIPPFTYMPFGGGPRVCIGERFGYQTMRHGLSQVFMNFSVKPYPDSPKPSDCAIDKKAMFLIPGEPLHVQFIPRK